MDRYTVLYTSKNSQYSTGLPLILLKGQILKDNQTNQVFLRLKFQNVQSKEIKALKLKILEFQPGSEEEIGSIDYNYLDLHCKSGLTFGEQTLIELDPLCRDYKVDLKEVVFADNTTEAISAVLEPLEIVDIRQKLNPAEIKELCKISNVKDPYLCQNISDLWLCTCGTFNPESEETCSTCYRAKNVQKENQDPEFLRKSIADKRVAQDQKNKNLLKVLGIIAVVICVVFAGYKIYEHNENEKKANAEDYYQATLAIQNDDLPTAKPYLEKLSEKKYKDSSVLLKQIEPNCDIIENLTDLNYVKSHINEIAENPTVLNYIKNHLDKYKYIAVSDTKSVMPGTYKAFWVPGANRNSWEDDNVVTSELKLTSEKAGSFLRAYYNGVSTIWSANGVKYNALPAPFKNDRVENDTISRDYLIYQITDGFFYCKGKGGNCTLLLKQ
ncbi:MAG: hypothetical protein HUJ54_01520 [Erysipelotrichaceae bacterium]|nr:hypothetical protein [Erysipelotrichaceae bacterium]